MEMSTLLLPINKLWRNPFVSFGVAASNLRVLNERPIGTLMTNGEKDPESGSTCQAVFRSKCHPSSIQERGEVGLRCGGGESPKHSIALDVKEGSYWMLWEPGLRHSMEGTLAGHDQ